MNRPIPQGRGKMIGGSTGLNYMAWDRASISEYDSWAQFGGKGGWNYQALLPYFIKAENFNASTRDQFPGISPQEEAEAQQAFKHENGFSGPIKSSYNSLFTDNIFPLVESWNNFSIPTNPNAFNGHTVGVRNQRNSIDRSNGKRSYAATGLFCPAAGRKNLFVIQGAQASKVLLSAPGQGGLRQATGVSFVVNGVTYTAHSKREVIVSAGAYQTPQILELSGIGSPSVLNKFGIKTLINLPGVGENLMDPIFVPSQYRMVDGVTTYDKLRNDPGFLQEQTDIYNQNGTGFLASIDSLVSYVPFQSFVGTQQRQTLAQDVQQLLQQPSLTPLQKKQYPILQQWLKGTDVPQVEVIIFSKGLIDPADGSSYMTMASGILHPLSRGTVHIGSSNPLQPPTIDPNYLGFNYDVTVLREGTKLALNISAEQPIVKLIAATEFPPSTADADLDAWTQQTFLSSGHPIGTAAMAEQSLGGVVNNSLVVYGTSNLRVADASIIPMSLAAHIQATVYAIGEKAADLIKQGINA